MIAVYVNAEQILEDRTKVPRYTKLGDGRIVLGRAYSGVDKYYTSMEVDQVTFYDDWLDPQEIQRLYIRQLNGWIHKFSI